MLNGIPFSRAIAMLNGKGKSRARTKQSFQQSGDESTFTVIIRCKRHQGKNFFGHAKSRSVYGEQTKESVCVVRVSDILSIIMKLLEKVTAVMRRKHYALRTEKTYRHWIKAFLRFHRNARGWRHPSEMGVAEIESFLTHKTLMED
jgi:hypothetical protein